MKKWILFMLLVSIIGCASYLKKESDNAFQGLWHGVITDKYGTVDVVLDLDVDNNVVKGKFNLLNVPGSEETMVFGIVNAEIIGNKIKFIVPITGKIDDDALQVEAELQDNYLVGTLQEMRFGSVQLLFYLSR